MLFDEEDLVWAEVTDAPDDLFVPYLALSLDLREEQVKPSLLVWILEVTSPTSTRSPDRLPVRNRCARGSREVPYCPAGSSWIRLEK